MIGWLKWIQWKFRGPYKRWDYGVLYAILFLTIFRLSEVDYIVKNKPDILGAIIPALQHPFQGTDWQAPYGLIWYAVSEAIFRIYPTAQGYVTITAIVDGLLMWKIRNDRLVLILYMFSSWYEYNQAPYNLPPMWMSLLGLVNSWAILLGPLTKFPDLPNQIAFVFYTPILSTQGNYNRFWQLWFYFLILLPSIGILMNRVDWRWIIQHRILHRDRTYWMERDVVDYISSQSGGIFLDIGSNKGFYSRLAKKRFKRVISVEPDLRCRYNHPLRYFLTKQRGVVSFYYNDFNDLLTLNSDFHVHGNKIGVGQKHSGIAITYDDLWVQADLAKLDVEGAEFDVLDGMQKYRPQKIIIELHDERRAEELCNKLIEKGYDVSMLDGYHFLGESENLIT